MAQDDGDPVRVSKIPTGVPGLDALLEGGAPAARAILISGEPGTGKTVLLNSFLYHGITRHQENGVLVTFEESPEDVRRNVAGFGWDYDDLEATQRLAIVDTTPETQDPTFELSADYDLSPLLEQILAAAHRVQAKRVAIDGVAALFTMFRSEAAVRQVLRQLLHRLKAAGLTTLLSADRAPDGRSVLSEHGLEEFVADGIIALDVSQGELRAIRTLVVRKMRGVSYQSGTVSFTIGRNGIEIFPHLPFEEPLPAPAEKRASFGIPAFDSILQGGPWEGQIVLISGNTGTGKTTFCTHFLQAGIEAGEPGVFMAIEEPTGQVRRAMKRFGWDLAEHERQGHLRIVPEPTIDLSPARVLLNIRDAVLETGAKRLVIESLTGMESAFLSPEQVRLFLDQLTMFCKAHGVTCVLSYTAPKLFGATVGQLFGSLSVSEARLSSLVDVIVLLRFVERERDVVRLLNVLKMRGSAHNTDIYRYSIANRGIQVDGRIE